MKRIYILFTLFLLTFSSSFSFADERHDIIINDYKETHSLNQGAFYTLDEIINANDDLNDAHLVLTGQELRDENNRINELLQNSPDLHIILDVQEGDGLVENGSLTFGGNLTQDVRKLTIANIAQDVTIIGDNFMCSPSLTDLDFSSLSQVTQIGVHFLSNCTGLTYLDLSPFSQVTQIKDCFLSFCTGLTNLDLSPLSQVTQIENFFLQGCAGLTNLDLSPLSQVNQIGSEFISYCTGLIHLDLCALSQVRQIGNYFLSQCNGF
ncbi:MAG: leucine-rich repeat protein, partial [Alphaproteobacteria bacterium]|nr:leucine-rich repeat protein [Alphaproteobacteria bacterium]